MRAGHRMTDLESTTIRSGYRIVRINKSGGHLERLGNLEYKSSWGHHRILVKWSMVLPCEGISQKVDLELHLPTLEPLCVNVATDMPGKRLSVEADYSCSVDLHHFRPLTVDFARMIAVEFCLTPKDFWGKPALNSPEKHSFLIPRRPNIVDGFGILETIRRMILRGESARRVALFDVNSSLYFDCMVSSSGKQKILTDIGEFECLKYKMTSVQPDSGISVIEYFYFCPKPPSCLIRHVRPSQLLEIVDLTQ